MSNVIKFPVPPADPIVQSNVECISDLDLGHEVARYCLEQMFSDRLITRTEYDVATQFVDFSYITEKFT